MSPGGLYPIPFHAGKRLGVQIRAGTQPHLRTCVGVHQAHTLAPRMRSGMKNKAVSRWAIRSMHLKTQSGDGKPIHIRCKRPLTTGIVPPWPPKPCATMAKEFSGVADLRLPKWGYVSLPVQHALSAHYHARQAEGKASRKASCWSTQSMSQA